MFGFSKKDPDEARKVALFEKLVENSSQVSRYSYRKNGCFEIIFDGNLNPDLNDPAAQSVFNLLAHTWLVIWGNDKAELHVGLTTRKGYRIVLDASKIYVGHKFQDHDKQVDDLLGLVGISRR